VTIIQTKLGATEAIDHPANERHLTAVAEQLTDRGRVKLEDRAHAEALQVEQQTGPPTGVEHHVVLAVVPALQPVTQLCTERPVHIEAVEPTELGLAQRARRSQPPSTSRLREQELDPMSLADVTPPRPLSGLRA